MRKFEEFTQRNTVPASTEPTITINHRGYFGLNQAAALALGEPKRVVLLYDKQNNAVGIKPVTKELPHSYPLRQQTSGRSYLVSASAFCKHYGIDISKPRKFKAQVEGNILVFDLSEGVEVTRPPSATSRKK